MTVSLCCLQRWTVRKGDSDTDSFTACFMDRGVVSHHICCYDLWKQTNAGDQLLNISCRLPRSASLPPGRFFNQLVEAPRSRMWANASLGWAAPSTPLNMLNLICKAASPNHFTDAVTEDEIKIMRIKSIGEEECTVASYWTPSIKRLVAPSYTWGFR